MFTGAPYAIPNKKKKSYSYCLGTVGLLHNIWLKRRCDNKYGNDTQSPKKYQGI